MCRFSVCLILLAIAHGPCAIYFASDDLLKMLHYVFYLTVNGFMPPSLQRQVLCHFILHVLFLFIHIILFLLFSSCFIIPVCLCLVLCRLTPQIYCVRGVRYALGIFTEWVIITQLWNYCYEWWVFFLLYLHYDWASCTMHTLGCCHMCSKMNIIHVGNGCDRFPAFVLFWIHSLDWLAWGTPRFIIVLTPKCRSIIVCIVRRLGVGMPTQIKYFFLNQCYSMTRGHGMDFMVRNCSFSSLKTVANMFCFPEMISTIVTQLSAFTPGHRTCELSVFLLLPCAPLSKTRIHKQNVPIQNKKKHKSNLFCQSPLLAIFALNPCIGQRHHDTVTFAFSFPSRLCRFFLLVFHVKVCFFPFLFPSFNQAFLPILACWVDQIFHWLILSVVCCSWPYGVGGERIWVCQDLLTFR